MGICETTSLSNHPHPPPSPNRSLQLVSAPQRRAQVQAFTPVNETVSPYQFHAVVRYKQRFFVSFDHWRNDTSGCVFFYLGNEADVSLCVPVLRPPPPTPLTRLLAQLRAAHRPHVGKREGIWRAVGVCGAPLLRPQPAAGRSQRAKSSVLDSRAGACRLRSAGENVLWWRCCNYSLILWTF